MPVEKCRVLIVGDALDRDGIDIKRRLLLSFAKQLPPSLVTPDFSARHQRRLTLPSKKTEVIVTLTDIAGREDQWRLRQEAYQQADVIIVLAHKFTHNQYWQVDAVKARWMEEIKRHAPAAYLFVLGVSHQSNTMNFDLHANQFKHAIGWPSELQETCFYNQASVQYALSHCVYNVLSLQKCGVGPKEISTNLHRTRVLALSVAHDKYAEEVASQFVNACQRGDAGAVEAAIATGVIAADYHWGNFTGLSLAVVHNHHDVAFALLNQGADPMAVDSLGRQPFDYIRALQDQEWFLRECTYVFSGSNQYGEIYAEWILRRREWLANKPDFAGHAENALIKHFSHQLSAAGDNDVALLTITRRLCRYRILFGIKQLLLALFELHSDEKAITIIKRLFPKIFIQLSDLKTAVTGNTLLHELAELGQANLPLIRLYSQLRLSAAIIESVNTYAGIDIVEFYCHAKLDLNAKNVEQLTPLAIANRNDHNQLRQQLLIAVFQQFLRENRGSLHEAYRQWVVSYAEILHHVDNDEESFLDCVFSHNYTEEKCAEIQDAATAVMCVNDMAKFSLTRTFARLWPLATQRVVQVGQPADGDAVGLLDFALRECELGSPLTVFFSFLSSFPQVFGSSASDSPEASKKHFMAVLEILRDKSPNTIAVLLNRRDGDGTTLLHSIVVSACREEHESKILRALLPLILAEKVDCLVKNAQGSTALDYVLGQYFSPTEVYNPLIVVDYQQYLARERLDHPDLGLDVLHQAWVRQGAIDFSTIEPYGDMSPVKKALLEVCLQAFFSRLVVDPKLTQDEQVAHTKIVMSELRNIGFSHEFVFNQTMVYTLSQGHSDLAIALCQIGDDVTWNAHAWLAQLLMNDVIQSTSLTKPDYIPVKLGVPIVLDAYKKPLEGVQLPNVAGELSEDRMIALLWVYAELGATVLNGPKCDHHLKILKDTRIAWRVAMQLESYKDSTGEMIYHMPDKLVALVNQYRGYHQNSLLHYAMLMQDKVVAATLFNSNPSLCVTSNLDARQPFDLEPFALGYPDVSEDFHTFFLKMEYHFIFREAITKFLELLPSEWLELSNADPSAQWRRQRSNENAGLINGIINDHFQSYIADVLPEWLRSTPSLIDYAMRYWASHHVGFISLAVDALVKYKRYELAYHYYENYFVNNKFLTPKEQDEVVMTLASFVVNDYIVFDEKSCPVVSLPTTSREQRLSALFVAHDRLSLIKQVDSSVIEKAITEKIDDLNHNKQWDNITLQIGLQYAQSGLRQAQSRAPGMDALFGQMRSYLDKRSSTSQHSPALFQPRRSSSVDDTVTTVFKHQGRRKMKINNKMASLSK